MLANIDPDIVAFLNNNHIAVLATASPQSGSPHAATVFYTTDSSMNIYFLTKQDTTKSKNLQANPQAALVVYDAPTLRTAQITAQAEPIKNPAIAQKALGIMSKYSRQTAGTSQPPIAKLDAGDYILYKLVPQTIRLADYKYGAKSTIFNIATPAEESLDNQ